MNRPYVICHIVSSVDGKIDGASVFDRAAFHPQSNPVVFKLLSAEMLDGDTIWIRCEPKNRK